MKKIFIILLSIVSFFITSCNKQENKSGKTIGITLLTRGHIFYKDLEEALIKEAETQGYELIITSAEFDLGKQVAQIEDFISRKVDAIIVCPVDSKGIGLGIKKANDANIPVFTADIASDEGDVVSHIASDNFAGGELAGEYLVRLLDGKGKIAIINRPTVTSVLDRVAGFRSIISKHPDIEVVADVNGEGVRDKSLQVTSDILQSQPQLKGIFGINDDSALGALDAVKQYKKNNIVIIGYDATPPAVDAILSGTALKADVVQHPDRIGILTIQTIKDYFEGKTVPEKIPIEVSIVDASSYQ